MKTEVNHYECILAGLLHDIGKFMQRSFSSNDGLSQENIALEGTICPVYQSRYTHRHVLYTSEFCDGFLKGLPASMKKDVVAGLAMYHHRPDNEEQKIITRADQLSSAMERKEGGESKSNSSRSFRKTRLKSILTEIQLPGVDSNDLKEHFFALDELTPNGVFPQLSEELDEDDPTQAYQRLWKKFLKAWQEVDVSDSWGFINRALGVLERFTWCIPSATNVDPDISLFDHLKTTAAIAACLKLAPGKEQPFRLVCADFGGIQKYIFNIRQGVGGIAKRLRARSLFVGLAGDSVAYHILRQLALPLTNCILASGGRFYLLLPNNEETNTAVGSACREMGKWSLRKTNGQVRLNIASLMLSEDELKDFSTCLQNVNEVLRQEKNRPLAPVLQSDGKWNEQAPLLEALVEGDDLLCQCCQGATAKLQVDQDGEEVAICDACNADANIGRQLPKSSLIAFYEDDDSDWALPFGSFRMFSSRGKISGSPYLVLSMDGAAKLAGDLPLVESFRARHVPQEDGRLLEFQEIAERSRGASRLAFLKADVDNLGLIFSSGFERVKNDRTSISRISTLSRSLDLFFSGYFETLVRGKYQSIYTIYSGGDDLLCLGPWDRILEFAAELRNAYSRFTCQNPAWSLSAGIALVTNKTPVKLAVKQTEDLLEASKNIAGEGVIPLPKENGGGIPEKNRLSCFQTAIPWEMVEPILDKAAWLLGHLEKGTLKSGQVRRLKKYAMLYRDFHRTRETRYLEYLPRMAYDLKRNWKGAGNRSTEEERETFTWAAGLAHPHSPEMDSLLFITEYALNGIRRKENDDGN